MLIKSKRLTISGGNDNRKCIGCVRVGRYQACGSYGANRGDRTHNVTDVHKFTCQSTMCINTGPCTVAGVVDVGNGVREPGRTPSRNRDLAEANQLCENQATRFHTARRQVAVLLVRMLNAAYFIPAKYLPGLYLITHESIHASGQFEEYPSSLWYGEWKQSNCVTRQDCSLEGSVVTTP